MNGYLQHPNGMRFSAYDKEGELIATNEFFSIGGGFVVNEKTQSVHLSESFLAVFKRQSLSHTARRRLSQCHISADLT